MVTFSKVNLPELATLIKEYDSSLETPNFPPDNVRFFNVTSS